MNHTPGPWGLRRLKVTYASGNPASFVYSTATGHNVADPAGRNEQETEANARLIAAAPEMFEALTLVLAGLKNASVKSKPIFSFSADATSGDMQSLEEIVSIALAKAKAAA